MRSLKFAVLTLFLAVALQSPLVPGALAPVSAAEPIRMIVPFVAGGSTDVLGRVIAKDLGEDLGTTVIVDNKPGAEGFIAARALKAARPDGATLMLLTTSVYAINPAVFRDVPYDSQKDFVTVGVFASSPNVIMVPGQSKYRSLKDIVNAAKAQPGAVNYATGATMHLLNAKWLETMSNTTMTGVPYKGSAAAYPDLIAGRVDFMVDQPVSSISLIHKGKLKVVAVTTPQRWAQMPDAPTVAEQGYPRFASSSWWAVVAPAGTPQDVLLRLNASLRKSMTRKETQERVRNLGADLLPMSLAESQRFTAQELEKWKTVARDAAVKLN
jgi:tripartite-type tricarboxylate transporter receptor subunit TctC